MKKIILSLIAFTLISFNAFATDNRVSLQDGTGHELGTAGNPLITHCISGCGASGASGNVGIGTVNFLPEYIGVNTLGPSNIVSVAGNVGIGTWKPSTTFEMKSGGSSLTWDGFTFTLANPGAISSTGQGGYVLMPEVLTPAPPAIGYDQIYFKADNNAYQQDRFGVEKLLGTSYALADATGSTALTPYIGVATTAMRSDASPGLDMTIAPTWIGTHKFQATTSIIASGNVGVGSTQPPQTAFVSMGNVGIGTFTATGGRLIVQGGNVGIGTVTAPQVLYVAGTGEFQGIKLNQNASAGYVLTSTSVGVGTWMPASGGGGSGTINSGTTNRFSRYSGATTLDSSTKNFDDGTNVGIGTINPRTAVELGVQAVNIVGSNVGVGSITPGKTVDVQGTGRFSSTLTASNLSGTNTGDQTDATLTFSDITTNNVSTSQHGFVPKAPNDATKYLDGTGAYTVPAGGGGASGWTLGASNVGISTTNNVGIGTNLTTTASLAVMGGNVGIGTWVPISELSVKGGSFQALVGKCSNAATYNVFSTNGVTSTTGLSGLIGGGDSNLYVSTPTGGAILSRINGVEKMRVDSTGNIGIGSTAPDAALTVDGTNTSAGVTFRNNGGNDFTLKMTNGTIDTRYISKSTNYGIFGTISNHDFTIATNNTVDRMRFTAAGNIGVGTSAASSRLSMFGNVGIGTVGNGDNYLTTTAPAGGMIAEGNIGIGTWNPIAPLSVTGHQHSHGTAPTVANNDCGTTSQGTVVAKSTDVSGSFTVGTLAVTSCAITFNGAWTNAPNCVTVDDSNIIAVKAIATTTKLTVSSVSSMSGDVITYICNGNE